MEPAERNTNQRKITAALKLRESRRSSLRTSLSAPFDYKSDCVVCGTPCPSLELRLKHPDRNPVIHVATHEVHDSMRTAAVRRNDDWGFAVRARCDAVIDLVAAEAMLIFA